MYAACTDVRLDGTYVYTYVRKCTYVYSACSSCPVPRAAYPLVPRVNGSLARLLRSDLLRRSTPLRTASRSLRPSPAHPHPLIFIQCPPLRLLSYMLHNASPHLVRLFFPSFVRVTLVESKPGVSETSMRDSSSFLVSSLSVPIRFLSLFRSRPHSRQDTRALLSFPRLRPFPVPIRRVSTVNRYFRSNAFRLSIANPLSYTFSRHVARNCLTHRSFFN